MSCLTNELGGDPIPDSFPDVDLFVVDVISEEYAHLIQYLTHHTFPPYFTDKMNTQLVHKSALYTLIGGVLYKKGRDEVLRRCIFQSEVDIILEGYHLDSCGGYFAGDSTARKALMASYWWPTMFFDAHQFVRRCDACQRNWTAYWYICYAFGSNSSSSTV